MSKFMKYFFLMVLCSGCACRIEADWDWGHGKCIKKERVCTDLEVSKDKKW